MKNEEFADSLGFAQGLERDVCIKIRETTSKECKLTVDLVTPSQDTHQLNRRTVTGWENEAILMDLEQAYGVDLSSVGLPNFTVERFFFFYKKEKPASYGEWVKKTVQKIAPVIADQIRQRK